MGEEQLPIIKSRPRKGRVQLHRLEGLHQFTCCRCRHRKRSLLVALVDNDVARPICNGCYGSLKADPAAMETVGGITPGHPPYPVPPPPPSKPKPAPKATEREQQQQKEKKKKEEEKKRKAEERARRRAEQRAKRELELLRQAEVLFRFFRRAGVEAGSRHGEVIVNGKKVIALRALRGLRRSAYEDLRDQIAAVACSRQFVETMKRNAAGVGEHLRAYYDRDAHGFELRDGDEAIALICAGRARIYGGATVEGNFLVDGSHWRRLRAKLAEHKAQEDGTPKPEPLEKPATKRSVKPPRRRILLDDVPEGLSPKLVDAVLEASRKIRHERRLAFDRPVTLEYELGSLILSPIAGTPEYLRVPFVFLRERKRVDGDILLSSNRDPVPVHIDENAGPLLESVWAGALLALADATCFELPPPSERRQPTVASRPSRSRNGRRKRGSGYRRLRSSPSFEIWPAHLRPVGTWARYSGAFVSGHRRRLRDGWSASAKARENARRVGIALAPSETWVKPHARGLPDNLEVRFKWQPAEPLLTANRLQGQRPSPAHATAASSR